MAGLRFPSTLLHRDCPSGFLLNPKFPEKVEGRFSAAPLVDLSLSPPSGLDSPNGSNSLSPERQGSGDLPPVPTGPDFQPLRYLDGVPSSFQFFLPFSSGGALHLPAASFLTPPKDKCLSPELPLPKQLVCRWAKCHQLFELLQDLVDHVNDYHVKPEKDAGYCCHWEGCARHGRGFNLNLAKNPLLPSPFGAGGLGLPVVSLLAGSAGGKAEGEKRGAVPARALGAEGRKTPLERTESARSRPSPDGLPLLPGTVLDLSTGVNSAASSPEALAPGWVVIPPGSVLLKPAVVN
ncbi:PREDICTED: zinc finger protein GLIS2 [Condylura cristata]|uniref:zinc finger protein GLIS2 n=1 Tax=Condylura cristata TaxID=143302 RepID=UPI000643E4FE|nr:PREDICTED: zinc finger protein GLIS2 [Condylura cristata]